MKQHVLRILQTFSLPGLYFLLSLSIPSVPLLVHGAPSPKNLNSQIQQLLNITEKSKRSYEITRSLSTEIGPRMAGSPQEEKARQWAIKKFKQLGFSKVWIEEFKVPLWKRKQEKLEVLSPFPQNLHVTALGGSVATSRWGIQGEVIRFSSLEELKKSPPNSLKDKIVFVDQPMARTKNGSGYSIAVKMRYQVAIEAGKRNAIGALIRSVGTSHHRFAHTGGMSYENGVKKIPLGALAVPDAEQLSRLIGYGPVKLNLILQSESSGLKTSGNVIAEIPGETSEIILAGAHIDSWDLGTGALDDGAGVGIVMAAASHLKNLNIRPKRTLRVVLFGSEEAGLVGAKAYAKKYKSTIANHVLASESDFGAKKIYQIDTSFPKKYQSIGVRIQKELSPLGVAMGNNEAYGGPDIIPLKELGVTAISLKQEGWDYFDYHHTANDTFDKIKLEDIRQNERVWSVFLWTALNLPGRFSE